MHVGIVGGGITGLTTAYYLLKAGHRATVFEASPSVGGLASSVRVQGVWIDKFYHCILPMDTALLSLVEELGMGGDVYWRETEMGFMYRERVYSLTTPSDLLRFSPLSVIDRLRLGLTGLYARRLRSWEALERVTAKDWLTRLCGERAFNTIWKPLLVFKFGDRYAEAPATYLWGRVRRQATTRRGRSTRETLAYVRGGFKAIFERLAGEVERLGGVIHTNTKVDRIVTEAGRVQGIRVKGELQPFDKVVSTPRSRSPSSSSILTCSVTGFVTMAWPIGAPCVCCSRSGDRSAGISGCRWSNRACPSLASWRRRISSGERISAASASRIW